MKKLILFFVAILAILAFFLFIKKEDSDLNMSFSEMEEKIANNADYLVIDVRTKEEYASGKILDAINVPLDEIENFKEENKSKYLFVYCRSGNRSGVAVQKLRKMGYKNAYNVGGIIYYNK